MMSFYILKSVVDDEDYLAEKVNVSEKGMHKLSISGVSLKDKELKIELKKNKGNVRNVISNLYGIPIISELISDVLLSNCPNEIELFEVKIDMKIESKFYFLNILDNVDAIDFEKSIYVEIMPETKVLSEITKLVLNNSKVQSRHIFRLKHFRDEIVVSEDLKNRLEDLKISEYKFIPIEDFEYKAGRLNRY
ncbi:Imm43 family immunity protein [Flavobacterium cerinum]|uniref:Immunity MXAN-0049 protein domain-containing protein n=1 Tax=Flavobacterium cerinum TaxID=2502784 RepID=A0ABY5IUU8_9FLAO|nr:DUF1629 domain-containing protein [Flavobacterium cerinum]UUC46555.1 hypothetical protein NOX80_04975 [Flavobacterium cerinum]